MHLLSAAEIWCLLSAYRGPYYRVFYRKYYVFINYKWEGRMGKYLARGHGVWTESSEVRAP